MGKVIIALGGGGGLDTDECTAGRPQVLSGYTAGVRDEDDPAPGSMPDKGAWTGRIGVNGKAVIPAGYHNGSGYVDQAITNRGAWTGSVAMNGSVTVPEGYHNGSGRVSGPSVTQRGAVSAALNCGGSYTVPEGYHNGAGKITANSLASQTGANAGASDIISGRTAWVNGARVTGNMADYRSTPTAIDAIRLNNNRFEVAVKAGCHGYNWAGNGYEYMSYAQVAGAIGLSAGVIKKGVRIMNLTGTFEGWVPVATDLYYMGVNTANITITNYAKFENTQITWIGSYIYFTLVVNKTYNVQSFSRLNLSGNFVIKPNTTGEFSVQNEGGTKLSTATCGNGATSVSINIAQLTSLNSGWKIYVYGSVGGFYINHIWLS